MTFALSVLALILGPFVYALGRRLPNARQILDGFIFVTIAGIVCVDIIPTAIENGGLVAMLFLILGLAFPVLVERYFEKSLHEAHVFILILAALGLTVHAMIDGIALLPLGQAVGIDAVRSVYPYESMFDNQLAVGVILHRLPVGMAIWWSVRPSFGAPAAVATLGLIVLATALAYFLGQSAVEVVGSRSVAFFQAFVAGSLVHVVAFGVSHDHADQGPIPARPDRWGYRVGILTGLFLIFTVPHMHA